MILVTYILTTLLSIFQRESTPCQCFANDSNEVVCINDSLITYRLLRGGGFTTYTIGGGEYRRKRNKLIINHHYIDIMSIKSISKVTFDSIKICFKHPDGTPIQFATLLLNLEEYGHKPNERSTGESGCISICANKYSDKLLKLQFNQFGLTFEQRIIVTGGFDYELSTGIPMKEIPISIFGDTPRKYIKIEIMGDSALISDSFKKEPRKFYKIESGAGHDCMLPLTYLSKR